MDPIELQLMPRTWPSEQGWEFGVPRSPKQGLQPLISELSFQRVRYWNHSNRFENLARPGPAALGRRLFEMMEGERVGRGRSFLDQFLVLFGSILRPQGVIWVSIWIFFVIKTLIFVWVFGENYSSVIWFWNLKSNRHTLRYFSLSVHHSKEKKTSFYRSSSWNSFFEENSILIFDKAFRNRIRSRVWKRISPNIVWQQWASSAHFFAFD